ncbi:hypothetical protein [Geobacter sp.]|uniref:hypothetical protein n=1 Tax=Geobacter sp. TaxID=46610 RepID=UPI002626E553|nr:hypothetical protein [Geobacter sp.]
MPTEATHANQAEPDLGERLKSPDEAVARKATAEAKKNIANVDGATICLMAYRLFLLGERDEAVFWFYAGQLRLRYYLGIYKGDPTAAGVLDAVVETFGPPINQYAFGDIPKLAKTIGDVLAWDEKTPNHIHPPLAQALPEAEWPRVRERIRSGMLDLKQMMLEQADEIRAQRKAQGID